MSNPMTAWGSCHSSPDFFSPLPSKLVGTSEMKRVPFLIKHIGKEKAMEDRCRKVPSFRGFLFLNNGLVEELLSYRDIRRHCRQLSQWKSTVSFSIVNVADCRRSQQWKLTLITSKKISAVQLSGFSGTTSTQVPHLRHCARYLPSAAIFVIVIYLLSVGPRS